MLKNLYEYEVLIDAEGKCENYTISGYVGADDYHQAKDYMKKVFAEQGEKVIAISLKEVIGLVDVAV